MSTEQNKNLVIQLFEEGFNQQNLDVFDQLLAPHYVNYDMPAPTPGPDGFKAVMGMFFTAFPDLQVTVEDAFAEGDTVVTRGTIAGTHRGDFQGLPPTGRHVKISYIDIWRVANGKLAENWVRMDQLGMMQQLGVIPS